MALRCSRVWLSKPIRHPRTRPLKQAVPSHVEYPLIHKSRANAFQSARLTGLETPFCYTEHNRIVVSGKNGTFAYKVPNACAIEQNGELVSMEFVRVVDITRAVTRSFSKSIQHYVALYAKHASVLRDVVASLSFVETSKLALVGRTFRFDYKNGVKSVNVFTMRLDRKHDQDCALSFPLQTAVSKDPNGNTVVSISSLPIERELREKNVDKLHRMMPTEMYTGKGFVKLDQSQPIQLKGKGPPL